MYSALEIAKKIAAIGIESQEVAEEDILYPDGTMTCGKCKKPKRAFQEVPTPTDDDPDKISRIIVPVMCDCSKEKAAQKETMRQLEQNLEKMRRLKNGSLMDSKFVSSTFDTFQKTKYNERNLKLCKRYAENFEVMVEKKQGLLMWGNVGTGKSYAAACIANHLLSIGVPVVMTSFVRLLEDFGKNMEWQQDIMNRLNTAKLLIVDDLGAERNTAYALEKVYNIIDSRYRSGLPMIVTTNLTINEMMEEYDIRYKRIYDRIIETCYPMQFTGYSWRQKTANERFKEMQKLLED